MTTETADSRGSFRHSVSSYYELCKPNVVYLIMFTALVGMLLAGSEENPLSWLKVCLALLGIGFAAAAGAAINHLVDRRIDAVMDRTKNRPLPQGEMSGINVLVFAAVLTTVAMLVLVFEINALTAILTFIALIGYAIIYTMFLKRTTPQNIVLGGAAGAAPPLLGWVAMTGEISSEAILLFLIIFVWTPPHFWSLAIRRRDEYAGVGVPMLPVTHGIAFTKLHILLYTILLLLVSTLPFVIRMSGLIYLAGALALGVGFLYHVVVLYRSKTDDNAMRTFGYSIFYLCLLFAFFLADHYARVVFNAFFVDVG